MMREQQDQTIRKFISSAVVSEIQSSDIYLTIKARLFDLKRNKNGVILTEAFLDEIVANEDKYICIPVCADVFGLINNRSMGHRYDKSTGQYHSTQIGSFRHFEKETVKDNAYLVGYARIMKRNAAVCSAISQLFADGDLKFSYEITSGAYEEHDDGTIIIDASEKNYLEGEAIVTFPACKDAVALQLVAECMGKGDESMKENTIVTTNTVSKDVLNANVCASTGSALTTNADAINAQRVIVEHRETEHKEDSIYDSDSGAMTVVETNTNTMTRTPVEIAETEPKGGDSEDDPEEIPEEHQEDDSQNAACEKKKKCAEQGPSATEMLAEIQSQMKNLFAEIEKLKAEKDTDKAESFVAEAKPEAEQKINPFMAEIATNSSKYTLLEKDEHHFDAYTLLDRA